MDAPKITFYYEPSNKHRPYQCEIRLKDSWHAGEGSTPCEALMLATVHWAMHGNTKETSK